MLDKIVMSCVLLINKGDPPGDTSLEAGIEGYFAPDMRGLCGAMWGDDQLIRMMRFV